MAAGGAQHALLSQALWFRDNGYDVVVAFFYDKEGVRTLWEERHAIKIVDLKGWQAGAGMMSNLLRLLRSVFRLHQLITRNRINIIETFTHHANLLGLPVAWVARVPVRVGTHHGQPAMGSGLVRLHSFLANAGVMTHLVVVSEYLRKVAIDIEGVRPERLSVIVNGIVDHTSSAVAPSSAEQARSELDVPEVGHLVLTVARLIPEKGHMHLIEAMPKVLERFPDTVFAIAGDGPLRDVLWRRVQELGLADSVRFLGTRTDVPSLLAAADLFAYPSVRDGCPLALLEALSARIPIVASTFEGAKGVLEHEKTALLVPTGDTKALAAALMDALASPELRQALASAGAVLISQEFSLQTMCQRYERLFQRGAFDP
jgi:glycosyltransferase involved in cell wall biosynthesis